MTDKPSYIVHTVPEEDVTVDWFYGPGHVGTKLKHTALLLVAWFFAVLPVVITASAIVNRDNPNQGWWDYAEGFALWDATIAFLCIFIGLFIVGYLVLFIANRAANRRRKNAATYDEERLAKRLAIAQSMYVEKFGPRTLRIEQRHVQIQPYSNIETYELRGHYRSNGVE